MIVEIVAAFILGFAAALACDTIKGAAAMAARAIKRIYALMRERGR